MPSFGRTSLPLFAIVAAGCSGAVPDGSSGDGTFSEAASRIINGNRDYSHQAVVATFGYQSACTGTIIHVDGSNLYVLTAAHCVVDDAPQQVAQGDDYEYPDRVYDVAEYRAHPSYYGAEWDFAMLRATGATGTTPLIPAMSPLEDELAPGTDIRHVGFGVTQAGGGDWNSARYETTNTIAQFDSNGAEFVYEQPYSGPCSGDSGGPGLTIGDERVAGVVSRGDEYCNQVGIDGRVSRAYDDFIVPFIGIDPVATCGGCSQAAVTGGGACAVSYDGCQAVPECAALATCIAACGDGLCAEGCFDANPAGAASYRDLQTCLCTVGCADPCAADPLCTVTGGSGGSGGTGGTAGAPPSEQWVAGDQQNVKYSGEVLGASCALHPGAPARIRGLWLLLAVTVLARSPRRRLRRPGPVPYKKISP